MWFGFHKKSAVKPDMSLPIGAPGHLEPENGPVFKRKRPPIPGEGDAVGAMIGQSDDPANNAAPNKSW